MTAVAEAPTEEPYKVFIEHGTSIRLASQKTDPAWKGTNTFTVTSRKNPIRIDSLLSTVEPLFLSMKGKTFLVYNDNRSTCSAKITGFRLVGGVTPHFGFFQDDEGNPKTVTDAELVDEVLKEGAFYLMGDLNTEGCTGKPLWAMQPHAKPAWLAWRTGLPSTLSESLIQEQFEQLEEHNELQQSCQEHCQNKQGQWYQKNSKQLVEYFTDGSREYLRISYTRTPEGCDDFSGGLLGLWQIKRVVPHDFAEPKINFELIGSRTGLELPPLHVLFPHPTDVNLRWISDSSLGDAEGEGLTTNPNQELVFPDLDCGC